MIRIRPWRVNRARGWTRSTLLASARWVRRVEFARLWVGLLVAGAGMAAACQPERPQAIEGMQAIADVDDLQRALVGSGVVAEDGGGFPALGPQPDAQGFILDVGDELVYVLQGKEEWDKRDVPELLLQGPWAEEASTSVGGSPPAAWRHGKLIVVYPGEDGGIILALWALLGDPVIPPATDVQEPYPPAALAVLDLAAERLGVSPADLVVLDMQETIWPDSCLGLAAAGEVCASLQVEGWQIAVQAGAVTARFRADATGEVIRLESIERE